MDNQDKLFDKIKEASQNAEFKDFPGMEKVWSRVEEKLDKKEDKKTISLWKKVAIAASLLLLISLGSQFLQSDENAVNETPKVVLDQKEKDKDPINTESNEIISTNSEIVTTEEGAKILEIQKERQKTVAVQETIVPKTTLAQPISSPKISAEAVTAAPAQKDYISESNEMYAQEEKISGSLERNERESAKVAFAARETQKAKKPAPLVILNGNAMAHSDAAKRDKMMRSEIENVKPENMDSLLILDEPLYIIDGIYYSENDLFGNNPTSPYAPLDKQDIKTITILQDLEATSKYGEKGKKGVVIITTKNGKPTPKK
ncbi:hypothetical protein [Flavobacterium olei]|uniref:hypothetical protein n=1 Tax=Flavobacterium olei TaxID=1886782 RepID=UPI00321B9712